MILPRAFAIICIGFTTISLLPVRAAHEPHGRVLPSGETWFQPDTLAADSLDTELVIPNVFTPNDDEINDHFEVETDGVTVYEFTVFTRTGTRVFRSTSPRIFWDGRTNSGIPLKEGIYYYVIEAEGNPATEKSGFLYLYR